MSKVISDSVRISTILPNPDGSDFGRETVTLTAPNAITLDGWTLRDKAGHIYNLSGSVNINEQITFAFKNHEFPLNNKGDVLFLYDKTGAVVHRVSYEQGDVKVGKSISFPDPNESGKDPVPAQIFSILPDPQGKDADKESVTIKGLVGAPIDISGWKLTDKANHVSQLDGTLNPGESKTFVLKKGTVSLNNKGDEIILADADGATVHHIVYERSDVRSGVLIDFDPTVPSPTPGKARLPTVMIASLLPDPIGKDAGRETLTLKVYGEDVDLAGWKLADRAGHELELSGKVDAKTQKTFFMTKGGVSLNNKGDEILLMDPSGKVVHSVEYSRSDVKEGVVIDFGMNASNSSGAQTRIPTVFITSILPNPDGQDKGRETITLQALGGMADLTGWKLKDRADHTSPLEGFIGEGKEKTFLSGVVSLNNDGDVISLLNAEGAEVHRVAYEKKDVKPGVAIDFGKNTEDPEAGIARVPTVQICSMLPNPEGADSGRELIVLKARGGSANLTGWSLMDAAGHKFPLEGGIQDGEDRSVLLTDKKFSLNNKGDTVNLVDENGMTVSTVTYEEEEVISGVLVDFGTTAENMLVGKARLPTVMIARLLPDPRGKDAGRETITIKARGAAADLSGWKVKDKANHEFKLNGVVEDEKTFRVTSVPLNNNGDIISLIDNHEREVHRVRYTADDVVPGKELEF